jgi:hypothetical protein
MEKKEKELTLLMLDVDLVDYYVNIHIKIK